MTDLLLNRFQGFMKDGGARFDVTGVPLERTWRTEDDVTPFETEPYLVMTYRASALYRDALLRQGVIFGLGGDGAVSLIDINDMILDGQAHRVIVKCERKAFDGLRVRIVTKAPKAYLVITALYTCAYEELPKRFDDTAAAVTDGYRTVSLAALVNGRLPDEAGTVDGGIGHAAGETAMDGIPFAFADGVIVPEAPPKENDDVILNINVSCKRRYCRPISRESRYTVPLGFAAKELYFVLAMNGLMHERCGFCAPDPTILGSAEGEVMMPLTVNDIERFAVILHYADGTEDECFPTRLCDGRHVISGETGVYGVVCEDKELTAVSFEDRMIDTDVCLCALTANVGADTKLGKRFETRVLHTDKLFDRTPRIAVDGDDMIIENGAFAAVLDLSHGIHVKEVRHGYTDAFTMGGALFKVIDGDNVIEEFETVEICGGKVILRYGDVYFTVTFAADVCDGVRMSCLAANKGEEVRLGIRFPALDDVKYGTPEDTWYFLPKYQNTESNGSCYVYEESAPSYPMQYFDIFDPHHGAGLSLVTHERDLKVRKYALIKQDGKLDAFVEYPAMYGRLPHDASMRTSETVLTAHEGDWRFADAQYKAWVGTWYEPYKCQNKMWYRRKFWLLAEIEDFIERKEVVGLPVYYDAKKKRFNFNYIFDEITKVYGETPDILHMWAWTWDNERKHQLWGNYNTYDYDKLGGLENFKAALKDASEHTGAEISLYMHPTLLSDVYPQAKEYFDKGLRVTDKNGKFIDVCGDSFRMCHANKEWREHALSNYPRVHSETGVRLLYVDEFSLRVDNRCCNDGHGHEVPSNLLKTDREFISALKDIMPEDVVLYGEYYPADVNARYIDCNISYYILDSINAMIEQGVHTGDGDDRYGRVFTDVYRFAFPKIVQLILPMAMRNLTWQPLKATFFNAEAIYDSFWDVEESRGRDFMAKSFRIKKKYADCFSCDEPETMLDTPHPAVFANRFDGDGRQIYTLFNRSYHTASGEVLAVKYTEGMKIYDVWNEREAAFAVRDGIAYISSRVTAQNVGAILVTR